MGERDLVLAIFRFAVCDYLGLSYGHDAADRPRRIRGCFATEAGSYLTSTRATDLADMAGFRAELVWRQAGRCEGQQRRRRRRWMTGGSQHERADAVSRRQPG